MTSYTVSLGGGGKFCRLKLHWLAKAFLGISSSLHDCLSSLHVLGPYWHNSYKKDRRLPFNADGSRESSSNDSGDHCKCPCPWPHRAHLLAVHKRGTRTQTQVRENMLTAVSFNIAFYVTHQSLSALVCHISPQWECERLLSPHCRGWWWGGHWLPSTWLQWANPQVWFQHVGLGGKILLSWSHIQTVTVCQNVRSTSVTWLV